MEVSSIRLAYPPPVCHTSDTPDTSVGVEHEEQGKEGPKEARKYPPWVLAAGVVGVTQLLGLAFFTALAWTHTASLYNAEIPKNEPMRPWEGQKYSDDTDLDRLANRCAGNSYIKLFEHHHSPLYRVMDPVSAAYLMKHLADHKETVCFLFRNWSNLSTKQDIENRPVRMIDPSKRLEANFLDMYAWDPAERLLFKVFKDRESLFGRLTSSRLAIFAVHMNALLEQDQQKFETLVEKAYIEVYGVAVSAKDGKVTFDGQPLDRRNQKDDAIRRSAEFKEIIQANVTRLQLTGPDALAQIDKSVPKALSILPAGLYKLLGASSFEQTFDDDHVAKPHKGQEAFCPPDHRVYAACDEHGRAAWLYILCHRLLELHSECEAADTNLQFRCR